MFQQIDFRPLPGLASPHLQMIMANYGPSGHEPPSESFIVRLSDGDSLSCMMSTPPTWKPAYPTIVIVHGVGGSHQSSYMIRLSRKFYHSGIRVVRVNLRGCGTGSGLNCRPYNSGNSQDIWEVVEILKLRHPYSPIRLLGFSLGGNLILKLAGEQGEKALNIIERITAVCPVIDLIQTINWISHKSNWFYHKYYLQNVLKQGRKWAVGKTIKTLRSFDDQITAPMWGYMDADDYYQKCSSYKFIPEIKVPCDILMTADDPFIDPYALKKSKIPNSTNLWMTTHGSHLGFIGSGSGIKGPYWMDNLLLQWHIK